MTIARTLASSQYHVVVDNFYAVKATPAVKRTPNAASAVDRALDDAEHVAAVIVPAAHEVAPDTVYPVLHVG